MRASPERNVLFHEDSGSSLRGTFVLGNCKRCDIPAKPIRVQQCVLVTILSDRQRGKVIDAEDLTWTTR